MCGLVGFVDFSFRSSKDVLERMTDTLSHRGPDGTGCDLFQGNNAQVGLGHKRLSILDLSELGRQPMYSADGQYAIIFNGEVYNFRDIRTRLLEKGYQFKSESDSEVILYALIEEGAEAIDRFIGMFAIVFFDLQSEKILLIRDRVGVKPLYYAEETNVLLFSSQPRAFHMHPAFSRELDIQAIAEFLDFGYIKKDRSIFKSVKQVAPGTVVEVDLKTRKLTQQRYWSIYDYFSKPVLILDFEEAKKQLEALLIDAFRLRMVSDVPVGVFLSGGIDSTTVAGILQKHHSSTISTFTIGFESKEFNEADKAKKIAKYLGTDHHELYCSERELLDIFPRLADIYDEPFADKSAIPSTLVSEFARKHVTVALSADGGDEVFAGYNKYQKNLQRLEGLKKEKGGGLKKMMYNLIYQNMSGLLGYQSKIYSKAYSQLKYLNAYPDAVKMMVSGARTFGDRDLKSLLGSGLNGHLEEGSIPDFGQGELTQLLAYDYNDYLPDDIMVKMDRAAMSINLEGREPLLDHRIAEFVARLPSDYKLKDGITKRILRSINHKYIPTHLTEGEKMGFAIPKKQWLETHLKGYVDEYLGDDRIRRDGVFCPDYVKGLSKAFTRGSGHNRVWNLMIFNMWYQRWM